MGCHFFWPDRRLHLPLRRKRRRQRPMCLWSPPMRTNQQCYPCLLWIKLRRTMKADGNRWGKLKERRQLQHNQSVLRWPHLVAKDEVCSCNTCCFTSQPARMWAWCWAGEIPPQGLSGELRSRGWLRDTGPKWVWGTCDRSMACQLQDHHA